MMRIKLSTSFSTWPLIRQTPGATGMWDDCQFLIDETVDDCDWWVVYEGLMQPETTRCPPQNIVFISGEPPANRKYNRSFLSQFSQIITSHRICFLCRRVLHTQQALPWHIGVDRSQKNVVRYAYDDFIGMQPPPKTGEIAVVVSSKTNREGHRKRLRFLKALKAHFGDRIEIFGRGIREVGDKWDAIAPFRYQIVMENSVSRHYFTEKITDAYLGFAYPFYYGCPNLSDYYPEQAFTAIDINQPDQAIATIEHSMRADLYSLNIKSIYEARDMTLNKYNLFPMLADICQSSPLKDKKSITLYPERRR
jgi:hypothetical protein